MKKVLFGIAVILFAMLMWSTDLWGFGDELIVTALGVIGLVIAGIGVFSKDK